MSDTNFISPEEAVDLIGREDVSFVDASWYLPAQERDGYAEYLSMRIPGACYFNIDKIADPDSDLPHMLPTPDSFARDASALGISHENLIIIYDGPGIFSSARVWWTLRVMGAANVRILEGGFERWKAVGLPVETGTPNPPHVQVFETSFDPKHVATISDVKTNISTADAIVIDARPNPRFKGEVAEPRAGLRSGHIPGSMSLPFDTLVSNGKLKSIRELEAVFDNLGIGKDTRVITSCGSGVTAAVLTLALDEAGRGKASLYDGSWAEWGVPDGPPIDTE